MKKIALSISAAWLVFALASCDGDESARSESPPPAEETTLTPDELGDVERGILQDLQEVTPERTESGR